MSEAGLPGAPQSVPGFPENGFTLPFEKFDGLNTKPLRPGIGDQEMSWCDGWMPIGPYNLRTLYGVGPVLYTAPGGLTILWYGFGNLQETSYCYVLLSDGSVVQVKTSDGSTTTVMPASTITSPTQLIGFSQWQAKYILFSFEQTNGYWIWDGTHLFKSGGIGPIVNLASSGLNYSSSPTLTLTTTGSGTGVTFSTVVQNGSVDTITVTNPGSGFAVDDLTLLTITGGGSDNTATALATISPTTGVVTSVTITNPGHGYDGAAYVDSSGGGASTQATYAITTNANGAIYAVTVVTGGVGYTSAPTLAPHGTGAGFTANADVSYGTITAISVTTPGSGYKSPPKVNVIGDGQGAVLEAVISATGAVTAVNVINGGYGYTKALIQFVGGNNAAEASVSLMPFGIQGSTLETYQNRVWIGSNSQNIPKGIFSSPDNPGDFLTSDSAGAFPATDAFLRVKYQRFIQSNGFLYLIGDSSMNYISGVSTSGTPPVTTFNNLNVDPQIGSPWPNSVQVYSRNIVFANQFGIHVSYGGAVTKVSQPLDGIYATVATTTDGTFSGFYPSSAVASIFGIQVYMLLLPIVDPYTKKQVNKLLMWDGKKWWTSPQDVNLTYIATQEINSVLSAWGTDGNSIYQLFAQPSSNFTKVVQSKLWWNPSYLFRKNVTNLSGIASFNTVVGSITATIDNEFGIGTNALTVFSGGVTWFDNAGDLVTWFDSLGDTVIWIVPGLAVLGPQMASQNGSLIGMTLSTASPDVSLVSMTILVQNYQTKV